MIPPPPKVSVCIDVYNYADFLPQAIESVLRQSFVDFELVIVDDCSTDGSYTIAKEYARREPRIVPLKNERNLGMVRNRNACLAAARGMYVKLLHADDLLWSVDALQRFVRILDENPSVSLVTSAVQSLDEHSRPLGITGPHRGDRLAAGTGVILHCLLSDKNLIGGPSAVMFRRSLAGRGFDETFFHAADLEMWFHLLEQGCCAFVGGPLTAYRWHPRQQTEKDRGTLTRQDDRRALLARYLERPYVRVPPLARRFLLHESVRQTIGRCRKLGLRAEAAAVLAAHGRSRYRRERVWCIAWRRLGKLGPAWYRRYLPPERPPAAAALSLRRPPGINIVGCLKAEYGVGESARAFCRAAAAGGLPHAALNVRQKNHRNLDDSLSKLSTRNPYAVNLMAFGFGYARRFYRDRGVRFFRGRRNIGLWYWELETFPATWHASFDYFDEIWAPTEYCRRAFAAVSPIPVHAITYPLTPCTATPDRRGLSLPDDAFVFLFIWDYHSVARRKNPIGLIEAFRAAFAPAENAILVLKSINATRYPQDAAAVRRAAAGLRVIFIDEHLSGSQVGSLLASADCYASLHRSEGLGLGLAQAMALAKPVIATGYSGNLEYMTDQNSLLVDYKLVEIEETCGPYERGLHWADPDTGHAAGLMRRVFTRREAAAEMGRRAQLDIRRTLDPARTIEQMRSRLAPASLPR